MNNGFDQSKRRTLKLLAGGAASGLFVGLPSLTTAGEIAANTIGADGLIDCLLISRVDGSRLHMLMQNKTNAPIVAMRMESQLIVFGGTAANLADAYSLPVIIPSNDRVMVRLNAEAIGSGVKAPSDVIDMNADTRYLPKGTREVSITVRLIDGVGRIENKLALA